MKRKATPLLNLKWAFKKAEEIEDSSALGGKSLECGKDWIVYLRAFHIIMTQSRAIQYPINVYRFILSLGLLFGNIADWILSTILILLPMAIIQSVILVLYLGKKMEMMDNEVLFWIPSSNLSRETTSNSVRSSLRAPPLTTKKSSLSERPQEETITISPIFGVAEVAEIPSSVSISRLSNVRGNDDGTRESWRESVPRFSEYFDNQHKTAQDEEL